MAIVRGIFLKRILVIWLTWNGFRKSKIQKNVRDVILIYRIENCTFQTMNQLHFKFRFAFVVVRLVRIPEETTALAKDQPKDQEKGGLDPWHDWQRLNSFMMIIIQKEKLRDDEAQLPPRYYLTHYLKIFQKGLLFASRNQRNCTVKK